MIDLRNLWAMVVEVDSTRRIQGTARQEVSWSSSIQRDFPFRGWFLSARALFPLSWLHRVLCLLAASRRPRQGCLVSNWEGAWGWPLPFIGKPSWQLHFSCECEPRSRQKKSNKPKNGAQISQMAAAGQGEAEGIPLPPAAPPLPPAAPPLLQRPIQQPQPPTQSQQPLMQAKRVSR